MTGIPRVPDTRHAVVMLQIVAVTTMVFPSDAVLSAVGAAGFVAALVALVIAGAYTFGAVLGQHDPLSTPNPVRIGLAAMWLASLASYAQMRLRGDVHAVAAASADRWLLLLVALSATTLVAAEFLRTVEDVRRVVRALVWGGTVCAAVAALQFWFGFDISGYLRMVPGFSVQEGYSPIMSRGALPRVAGTALHPIELGVVSGMLLPFAVYLALHDRGHRPWARWTPVALIASAAATSVSRSAVLSLGITVALLLLLLPVRQRVVGFALLPVGLVGVFMAVPGLFRTLQSFFAAGTNDPSVATRVDDYPMVEALVRQAPVLGHGPASYLTDNALDILDNQYLKTAVELGLVGLAALALYLLLPAAVGVAARARSRDPEVRMLALAATASLVAAAACSFTFDSFSFPMFTLVHALVAGLAGAAWTLSYRPPGERPLPTLSTHASRRSAR